MHSPVGWVCFGVLLVFAISAQAGILPGSYQIIHGPSFVNPGHVYQGIVPAVSYRSYSPQIFASRVEARNDEDEDSPDMEELDNDEEEQVEEEEENSEQTSGTYNSDRVRSDEEQDEEEENEQEEDNKEFDYGDVKREESEEEDYEDYNTRSSGVNHHQKYRLSNNINATTIQRKTPSKTRNSLRKNSSKIAHKNNNYNTKKRKTSNISAVNPLARSKLSNPILAEESNENLKQQLKPKISSRTQFITTPIADLILRLSISLARPVGHENGTTTFLNVPIRVSNSEADKINNSALNLALGTASKGNIETELQKNEPSVLNIDSPKDLPVPIPVQNKTEIKENQKKENYDSESS